MAADFLPRAAWEQGKRVFRAGISVFLANRRILGHGATVER